MPPPSLPPELLDDIVSYLHDYEDALKNCCLVSKSWIPRARTHLFADIGFRTARNLKLWKKTFPDPFTSPAHYTKSLFINCFGMATPPDVADNSWVQAFSCVERLCVDIHTTPAKAGSLVPFYGLSPLVKSLSILFLDFPPTGVFDFINSFPLLEDLYVRTPFLSTLDCNTSQEQLTTAQSQNTPLFTGTLKLSILSGIGPFAARLLSMKGGLHFRKLNLGLGRGNDIPSVTTLVEECSLTLESLDVDCQILDTEFSGSIDLSKAKNLREIAFTYNVNPKWVARTLRTITPDHRNFRRISFNPVGLFSRGSPPAEWRELDPVLAQLWESHSIHAEVCYSAPGWIDEGTAKRWMEGLLPGATASGIVDFFEDGEQTEEPFTRKEYGRTHKDVTEMLKWLLLQEV